MAKTIPQLTDATTVNAADELIIQQGGITKRATVSELIDAVLSGIYSGNGSPEGVITAPVGSLFLRQDGGAATTLYVKESGAGNTGWAAK